MKAIIHFVYAGPEYLELMEIPKPEPKPNELLIKIVASTVNRTDCAMLTGKFPLKLFMGINRPKKPSLGTDFAGIVEQVGTKVSKFKVGDRLFGFNDMGLCSHAEYTCVKENEAISHIPENISYEEIVACAEGFHYARNMINKIKLKENDRLLVIGATGAIGSACVQLARYYGANVTAVCKQQHADKIVALGANTIIDYTEQDYKQSTNKYHFIFDAVGKSSFGKCKRILKTNGIYISSELGPGNENVYLPLTTKLFSKKRVIFPFPTNKAESLRLVKQMISEGKYKPLIDQYYSLNNIPAAFQYALSGEKVGNLVVKIQNE